jgi:hypothetical protein
MTQKSSILEAGSAAVDGASASLVRLAAIELLLMVALVVIGLLACGALSRSASSMVLESTHAQPTAGSDIRPVDSHHANSAISMAIRKDWQQALTVIPG